MSGSTTAGLIMLAMLVVVVLHRRGVRIPLYQRYVGHRLGLSVVAAALEGGLVFGLVFAILFMIAGRSLAESLALGGIGFVIVAGLYVPLRRRLEEGHDR